MLTSFVITIFLPLYMTSLTHIYYLLLHACPYHRISTKVSIITLSRRLWIRPIMSNTHDPSLFINAIQYCAKNTKLVVKSIYFFSRLFYKVLGHHFILITTNVKVIIITTVLLLNGLNKTASWLHSRNLHLQRRSSTQSTID